MEIKEVADLVSDRLEKAEKAFNDKIDDLATDNKKSAEEKATEVKGMQDEITALKGELNRLAENEEKGKKFGAEKKKSFGDVFAETLKEQHKELSAAMEKGGKYRMELKAVGNMLLSSNLTGDPVATYNPQQAILPAADVNFRDLMRSVQSETGLYVTYKETAGEGAIAVQTEGASKGQIDYDFAEVKTVTDYVAGFCRFSKQMRNSLPWLQNTLPQLLLRSFYEVENSTFFTAVSGAATGSTTLPAGLTVDLDAIIYLIANQKTAKFRASYVLVSETQMARLIVETLHNGYYAQAGKVMVTGQGMSIWGVPVLSAPWVTDNRVLIVDGTWLERVETESLNIQFSMEDGDNFTKNLITARIECQEDVNLMLPQSAIFANIAAIS